MVQPRITGVVLAGLIGLGASACSGPEVGGYFGSGEGGGGEGGGEETSSGKSGSGNSSSRASSGTTVGSTSSTATTTVSTGTSGCDPDLYFTCNDGSCIISTWECDGFTDCLDASDEPPINPACPSSTTTTTTSGCNGFLCFDGECLLESALCNGTQECSDGADEVGCNPDGWTCEPTFYGTGDGCDCGCGIIDPDCKGSGVEFCQYCNNAGSCAQSCEGIAENANWRCGR